MGSKTIPHGTVSENFCVLISKFVTLTSNDGSERFREKFTVVSSRFDAGISKQILWKIRYFSNTARSDMESCRKKNLL